MLGSFFSLRATVAQSRSTASSAGLNPGPMPARPAACSALRRLPCRLYTCFVGTPAIARSSRRLGLRRNFLAHTRIDLTISSFVMIVLAVGFLGIVLETEKPPALWVAWFEGPL